MQNYQFDPSNMKKNFTWLFLLLAFFFLFSAYFYYVYEETGLIYQKQHELESIAHLKIERISKWYIDEKEDSEIISGNTVLVRKIKQFLSNGDKATVEELKELLENLKIEHDYFDIILTTSKAEIITSTNPALTQLNNNLSAEVINTASQKVISELDFFRSTLFHNKILLGFIAPIEIEDRDENLLLTFLIDPNKNVYSFTEDWPIPSKTSETFLFRVDGDNILYLNELKHRKGTALEFVLPKSSSHLPAAKAANGYKGIVRGKDYRDVNVVSFVSDIPGSNWYLVAKVDEDELFEGLLSKMIMVGLIVLLLIVLSGAGIYLLYSYRQHSLIKNLYEKDMELWKQQEKFKVTMDSLGQGVLTLDVNGKVKYMNKIAEQLTGWTIRSAIGHDLHEVYPVKNEQTGQRENNILDKIFKYGVVKELANHTILISKDGNEIPVMDTGAPVYDTNGKIIGVSIVFQDETERREQERKIQISEDRLRSTLDNMIEGCQIIGFDYKYLYLNKAAIESSRKSREELIGRTMMECYPGIENTIMFSSLKECMEKRIPVNTENDFSYPDGEQKTFKLRFEPVPEGLFVLSEDITEFKSAQEIIKKFRAGIELSGDAIFLTDREGIITYVNPAFEKVFGFKFEEVVGKTPRILKSGVLSIEYYENFWDRIKSNKPVKHEIINRTKDNRLIHVEASISPINNDAGHIIGYLAIERDITSRKVAEEKRKQLIAILDATPDFVAIANTEGEAIFLNNAGKRYLGVEFHDDIKTVTIAGGHPEWARSVVLNEGLPTAAKKGIWFGETALLHKAGYETPISQIIIAHKSDKGEVEYYSTIGRDITERKKFESELIEAKEKAEEMNEIKTIFFANMSHELRTPFVGIMGYAELLLDELHDEEHKEMARGILSTSQRMMDTLTKILKLTKLEVRETELSLKETSLIKLIEMVHNNFLPAARKANIQLKININTSLTSIITDEDILIDILFNLVSNAVKYTNEGEVIISTDKKNIDNKDFCSIQISDTGIGIPQDKAEIVWMEFRQASEGKTRNYQGAGLGLAIVKKNTELLGGRITFESEEGKGTTFTLLLPLHSQEKID